MRRHYFSAFEHNNPAPGSPFAFHEPSGGDNPPPAASNRFTHLVSHHHPLPPIFSPGIDASPTTEHPLALSSIRALEHREPGSPQSSPLFIEVGAF